MIKHGHIVKIKEVDFHHRFKEGQLVQVYEIFTDTDYTPTEYFCGPPGHDPGGVFPEELFDSHHFWYLRSYHIEEIPQENDVHAHRLWGESSG